MDVVGLLLAGAVVGVLAGLLGIGGGAIIVPVLLFLFAKQGADPDVIIKSALGTSFATIVFTSLSSIRAHHKRGAVRWDIFRLLAVGVFAGTLAGAAIADLLPGRVLHYMFGTFLLLVAAQMVRGTSTTRPHRPLPGRWGMATAGGLIGVVSAFFGIGGAALSVPFMTWCGVTPQRAVATSAAVGLPIALGGALGYILAGLGEAGRPPFSLGYVSGPGLAGIAVGSILFAPLGAWLAHKLPAAALRRIFAVFLTIVGLRLLLS